MLTTRVSSWRSPQPDDCQYTIVWDVCQLTEDYSRILQNIREAKRLLHMTEFQRLNERAADRKADRWIHYVPLTPEQLTDGGSVDDWIVVATDVHLPGTGDRRVTFKMPVWFSPVRIIKRPTEQLALHPSRRTDHVPITPIPRLAELRWCIYCKTRHPLENFIHSKRYLNEYSFACKASLRELRRKAWHFANEPIDSVVRIRIEKSLKQAVK